MNISDDWLTRAETQAVFAMLDEAGHQVFAVGGCVRNALMGVAVTDVDMSTDATPDVITKLAGQAGLKAIPTGIDHGTITVVSGGIAHEITSFRKDVATDGRRAVVTFSANIVDDARRRDFTMNAVYVDRQGAVVDPLGGVADLKARVLRFIDDPAARIREDYLRILRFFRFHAHYGDPSAGLDPEALAAIAEGASGLGQISKERITAELIKLLSAQDPAPSVAAMRHCGVLAEILPGADDRSLGLLVHLEGDCPADPMRRLACLGGDALGGLRLSNKQAQIWEKLRAEMGEMTGPAELAYREGAALARSVILLRSAMLETDLPADLSLKLDLGARAEFPISARDLMPDITGPALGETLKHLENAWIKSEFSLERSALLAMVEF